MTSTLSDRAWEVLLQKIANQNCVPFLGAGACYGTLPLGGEIAREWAKEYGYPFPDDGDLVKVAQYVAVEYDPNYPKEKLLDRFKGIAPPNFKDRDEPHAVLADLPLPIYLTTNYDDFMCQALRSRYRDPRREFCRWNEAIADLPSIFDKEPGYSPHPATPLVLHLHGHTDPSTLVLTEDDYLSFLAAMQDPEQLLPQPVRAALTRSSLLFIGYRMADWNIRVLLQGLRKLSKGLSARGNLSVMVLVPPEGQDDAQLKVQNYLDRYYQAMDLHVYWGTARQFCGELADRWSQKNR